jgi:predicted outer membrane lipoprotein
MLSFASGLWVFPLAMGVIAAVAFTFMDGRARQRRAQEAKRADLYENAMRQGWEEPK